MRRGGAIGVAALLLLAGCGDDGRLTKEQYVKENRAVQRSLEQAASRSGTATTGDAAARTAARTAQLQAAYEDAAADLRRLRPPEEWQDEHDAIVAGVEDIGPIIDQMQQASVDADVQGIAAAEQRLGEAEQQIVAAMAAIEQSR